MDLSVSQFPAWLLWLANACAAACLLFCLCKVKWREQSVSALNAWMGACVLDLALWLLRAGLQPGLSFHLLGGALFVLMMGPWLALPALALVQIALALGGHAQWLSLGVNWLLSALPAVCVASVALRLAQRYLPRHFFIYIFVNGFLAGGASLFAAAVCGMLALGAAGDYEWDALLEQAVPYYFLLSWSEAFLTGLLLAVLTVYRPQWVATFDDASYLGDKPDSGR
ncbi:energy-coupling factor ABC transporter permease [Chromobacterium sp. IIBBL 290-4]|uniref:energy-coupling factor ABC transporter permease n=1 Tax=Chromobacterium sp. IIBBL 290-4 TaxID=2953890 RepID=UPI0020B877C9|nr:energy-coupling factor ABC transporter permease [Chromobacterium sp. IIBBL 290-4]UTH74512.1 energy-coupling factor ABC transporter permease [Chromobacterium sp. IIBBL 290-4]